MGLPQLECVLSIPGLANLQCPKVLAGKAFDPRSWRPSPTERAFAALDLTTGATVLHQLMLEHALVVTGANFRYFWITQQLTPTERAECEAGRVSLSQLAQGRRKINGVLHAAGVIDAVV
jgi:hypothetical protein